MILAVTGMKYTAAKEIAPDIIARINMMASEYKLMIEKYTSYQIAKKILHFPFFHHMILTAPQKPGRRWYHGRRMDQIQR